jgi:glycosyltransferase involved in cell wall biosynthesis
MRKPSNAPPAETPHGAWRARGAEVTANTRIAEMSLGNPVDPCGRRGAADLEHPAAEPIEVRRGRALLLVAHEPSLDPRIDWFAEGLAANFEVCELGLHALDAKTSASSLERVSPNRIRVRVDGRRICWDFIAPAVGSSGEEPLGILAIKKLFFTAQLPARALGKSVGAADPTHADLERFRWSCNSLVKTNSALIEAARRIGGFDLVVAADLDTLPAAVTLAEQYGVPLVYDAHEYWPYAFPEFRRWESEFWSALEKSLVGRVALPLTVSPQLAEIMSRAYGSAFSYIPNCAPLGSETAIDLDAALAARARSEDVIFLVQGRIAPHRGLDKLIKAWAKVDARAKLWVRGPDSPEKTALMDEARHMGLLGQGVFFPDAVAEADLVVAAREGDIGLVPYEPSSVNNRYCSPNKLSQYMAAGLPIICNMLDYVRSVVLDNGIGSSVDFDDETALVRVIDGYVLRREAIPALSRKSQEVFKATFNWQAASRTTYERIGDIMSEARPRGSEFDFAWIGGSDDWQGQASAQEEQIAALDDEIRRLHSVYSQHQVLLQSELDRVNKVYLEEVERLSKTSPSWVAYYALRRVAHRFMNLRRIFGSAREKR